MRVVFLGPPGAGKGTQALRIGKDYRIPHISTGDLLRDAMARGTPLGLTARAYMDRGLLVPDTLVVDLVTQRLRERSCRRGFLLDGFPRNLSQEIALDAFFRGRRLPGLDAVIHFRIPEEVLIRRLTGRRVCQGCGANYHLHRDRAAAEGRCDRCGGELHQRRDDTLRTVLRRLQVYEEETARLIPYYRSRGALREVEADQEVEDVYRSVRTAIAGGRRARTRETRVAGARRPAAVSSRSGRG